MKLFYLFLFIIFFLSCDKIDIDNISIEKLPDTTIDAQYKIISHLSGNESIGNEGHFIKSRTTRKERDVTRKYLSNVINGLGLTPIEHDYKEPNDNPLIDLLLAPFEGTNLYTMLPSTVNSKEFLVIGGHYDTARNCPGANDNASAIGVIYGVLKNLKSIKQRKKNVIVVFFDQEEENLVGSRAFAKFLSKKKYIVDSVHTLDQLGWDEDLDKGIEIELPSPEIEKIYRQQADILNIPIFSTKVNSTDHQSFRDLGFNSVGITEEYVQGDTSPFKDTKNDTFNTIDIDFINSSTNLLFNVFKQLITKD